MDDGSADGTAEEARRAHAVVVSHPRNRGYGAALRSGFAAARQPWIFQMDCDNQFDPEDMDRLVPLAREAQIVIGVRVQRADDWRRIWAGRAWNGLCRLAFGPIVLLNGQGSGTVGDEFTFNTLLLPNLPQYVIAAYGIPKILTTTEISTG